MPKAFLPLALAAAFCWVQSPAANGATITFSNTLSGANETPPNSSTATGSTVVVFDTTAQNLSYTFTYSGLSANATAAHIHFGPVGVAGPIILPFSPGPTGTSGTLTGTFMASDLINQAQSGIMTFTDLLNAALANNLYSNVHNGPFPGGEIRGQLTQAAAVPEPSMALLFTTGLMALPFLVRRRYQRN